MLNAFVWSGLVPELTALDLVSILLVVRTGNLVHIQKMILRVDLVEF